MMSKVTLYCFAILASALAQGAFAVESAFVMFESPSSWRSYLTVSGEAQGIATAYHSVPSLLNSTFEFKDSSGANLAKA